jgi:hypothetical protein
VTSLPMPPKIYELPPTDSSLRSALLLLFYLSMCVGVNGLTIGHGDLLKHKIGSSLYCGIAINMHLESMRAAL